MRPEKMIILQGNVEGDVLEVEVWDGCMMFVSQDGLTGEVVAVLLHKAQIDDLKQQMRRYYDTLQDSDIRDGEYKTVWYDEQEAV